MKCMTWKRTNELVSQRHIDDESNVYVIHGLSLMALFLVLMSILESEFREIEADKDKRHNQVVKEESHSLLFEF